MGASLLRDRAILDTVAAALQRLCIRPMPQAVDWVMSEPNDAPVDNALVLEKIRAAAALTQAGQHQPAIPLLQALLDQTADDVELSALVASQLADALIATGQRSQALQLLSETATQLRDPAVAAVRARVLMQAATIHPDGEFAVQLAAEADALAANLPAPQPRVETLTLLLGLLEKGKFLQGIPIVADALVVQAERSGDVPAAVRGLLVLALDPTTPPGRDLDIARDAHARSLQLPAEQRQWRTEAARVRGQLALQRGLALEALEVLDQAQLDEPEPATALLRAEAALLLGHDAAEVTAQLHELLNGEATLAQRARVLLAQIAMDSGNVEEAGRWLNELPEQQAAPLKARLAMARGAWADAEEQLVALIAENPHNLTLTLLHAQALAKSGASLQAVERLDELLQQPDPWLELRVRLQRGPVLAQLGDGDAARQDARRALALAQDMHLPMQLGHAAGQLAVSLARLDLRDEAAWVLRDALDRVQRLESATAAAQLTALLGRLGESDLDQPFASDGARL